MTSLGILIILMSFSAGVLNAIYGIKDHTGRRYYILAKSIIMLYVCTLWTYSIAVDYSTWDILSDIYKRIGVFTLAFVALSDSIIRKWKINE